jgi:hypothetical protein
LPETPLLGIPYPAADDAITDWPAQAQELAESVEAVIVAAATELGYGTRATDKAGVGAVVTLPSIDFDGDPVWVEIWAAGVLAGPGSGDASMTVGVKRDGVTVQTSLTIPNQQATSGGASGHVPHYAKFKYTPPAGAAVLSFEILAGDGNSKVLATGVAPAWLRVSRAAA